MTTPFDITEDFPYDISVPAPDNTFFLSDVAYDFVIDNLPFIAKIGNQNPYIRQTAQYRKEQFDNSQDPGEQSLTGWWLRSQYSFHNGAGIGFYEPGTDKEHTSHRFEDSRGINVWDEGEAKPLKEVTHAYTGASNLCSSVAKGDGVDAIIVGGADGLLKKVVLNGDSDVTGTANVTTYTLNVNHNVGSTHPFYSITTDGDYYYALCADALHRGQVNGTTGDIVLYGNLNTDPAGFVKYAKGYVFFGSGRRLYRADTGITATDHHNNGGTTLPSGVNLKVHSSAGWKWNDLAAGTTHLYASGYSGNRSEIWSIPFDGSGSDSGQTATSLPNLPGSFVSAQLPLGEIVNCIEYYLGFLIIGTNRGVRIAQTGTNGDIAYGPLLYESSYAVNGLVSDDRFVYAATKVLGEGNKTHACLVRMDLSQDFGDGTFAYAYDLEYQSSINESYEITNKVLTSNVATLTTKTPHDFSVGNSVTVSGVGTPFDGTYTVTAKTSTTFSYARTASNVTSAASSGSVLETPSSSEAFDALLVDSRLVLVTQEQEDVTNKGELQVQSQDTYRSSGWLKTGKVRFGTIEPKFFRFVNVKCKTGEGDSIDISVIDESDIETGLTTVTTGLSNIENLISTPSKSQERMSFKFTFNNSNADTSLPILRAWQVKAIPAVRRQRMIQVPLSCFDFESDRYNTSFGWENRALELIQKIEQLEETGKFVTVTDYRMDETFIGVIEQVEFSNETSPDRNSSGFGGLLTITIRKI